MSEETEWVLIGLDEVMAKRQGLPPRLPVPKEEFEGMADKGLSMDGARDWIKGFLTESEPGKSAQWRKENHQLVSALEAFQDKLPMWKRAQEAFEQGDMEKAISTLKRITVMDPDDHAAKMNLAAAYANTGEHDKAAKAFKQIRDTFKGEPDFHTSYAQVFMSKQDQEGAIEQLGLALEAKPDHQPALDALIKLGVLVPIYENPKDAASLTYVRADAVVDYLTGEWDKETRTTDFYLEQMVYHEREQRFVVALEAAERGIKAAGDGSSERAEIGRVTALRSLGKAQKALEAAQDFAKRLPQSVGAQVELARSQKGLGNKEEARQAVEKALALDPGDQAALVLRFWPEDTNDLHTVNATIPELSKFAEAHEKVAGVWRSLARAMLIVGRTEEALDLFKRAVDLAPDDDDLRAEWWTELGKQSRYDEIIADSERVEGLKSRDWRLRWNEAEAYLGQDKKMEARTLFTNLNHDETLHVDIRKRAKRAVQTMAEQKEGIDKVNAIMAEHEAEMAAKADDAESEAAKSEAAESDDS